jgi:predicted phosphodiesterase
VLQLIERQRTRRRREDRQRRFHLPSWRRVLRAVAIVASMLVIALAGMLLGLRASGRTTHDIAFGRVQFSVSPTIHGQVDAFIPIADWGIRAHAFRAPLKIHVEPRAVRRGAVLSAAGGNGTVLLHAERDARRAARSTLLRAFLWAIGGALGLGAIAALGLAHRPEVPRKLVAATMVGPALCAFLIGGAVLLRLSTTFDPESFSHPRFYARGAELQQLLKVADNAQREAAGYTSQVQRAIGSFAALVATGGRFSESVAEPKQAILASDLHDNLLALKAVQRQFSNRPIFFPGDFGQTGSAAETRIIASRFEKFRQPIIAVSGNHDSYLLMRKLASLGVTVLTDTGRLSPNGRTDGKPVQDILGMRVAGYPDPLEARTGDPGDPGRIFSFAERPNGDVAYAAAQQKLLDWFDSLPEAPQIVLVHQNGLSQFLARTLQERGYQRRLVILTGHDHRQHIDYYGNVVVVDAGSVGAGGVFGASQTPVGFANLNLSEPSPLDSVDMVRVQPFTGSAQADRVVLDVKDPCRGEQPITCHAPPKD